MKTIQEAWGIMFGLIVLLWFAIATVFFGFVLPVVLIHYFLTLISNIL